MTELSAVPLGQRVRPFVAACRKRGESLAGEDRPRLPGSTTFMRKEVEAGRLRVIKFGGRVYISDEEILRYLAEAGQVIGGTGSAA